MAGLPKPREMPVGGALAIQIWNAMAGEIQWQALPILCAVHGIEDVEILIAQLIAIRETRAKDHGG